MSNVSETMQRVAERWEADKLILSNPTMEHWVDGFGCWCCPVIEELPDGDVLVRHRRLNEEGGH